MKKFIPAILMTLSLSLVNVASHAGSDKNKHEHDSPGASMSNAKLSLNDGEKWEMDDHTRMMSAKMQETFFSADHSTQGNLNALGLQLEEQLDTLIKGCTMTGASHDQLHLFLSGYMPAVQGMARAEDYDSARSLAIKIKGELQAYKQHFK